MKEPVYLRALELSDADHIHKWHNDRDLYELLGGPFHFVSKHAVEAWLDRKTAYTAPADEVSLAICITASDKHIGNIYLRQISMIAQHAEMQILIGDTKERGKGYGASALRQLLSYAFYDIGLNRVYLYVLAGNDAAIRSYEKAGFSIEGTLRQHIMKHGCLKDVHLMGLCARDYVCQPKTA